MKDALELYTGLSRDALHIYAAVVIQLLSAVVARRSLMHPLPWFCVLLFALLNESIDIFSDAVAEGWEFRAARHDLWNTMLMPSLLLLTVRYAPTLADNRKVVQPPHHSLRR